ncbi:hypothetical protein ACLMJK_006500 [Lecanora helva]
MATVKRSWTPTEEFKSLQDPLLNIVEFFDDDSNNDSDEDTDNDRGDDDSEITSHVIPPKSKIVVLKYKQTSNTAPVAKMFTPPSQPQAASVQSQLAPDQLINAPGDQAPHEKSFAESRAKRKDTDRHDEHKEPPPRRGKRRRGAPETLVEDQYLATLEGSRRGQSPWRKMDELSQTKTFEQMRNEIPVQSNREARLVSNHCSREDIPRITGFTPSPPRDTHGAPTVVNKDTLSPGKARNNSQEEDTRMHNNVESPGQAPHTPSMAVSVASEIPEKAVPSENAPEAWQTSSTSHPAVAERQQPPEPREEPMPEIRYYIISKLPHWSEHHWPDGSLGEKSVDAMFNDVEYFTSKRDIKCIMFKLTASEKDTVFRIARRDSKTYEAMKKRFSAKINASLGMGDTEFAIELELDPKLSEMERQPEGPRSGPRFSF